MATLADQRRSIAAGMRASRQGTSETERRAGGAAMVARRTGRDDVDDINAVVRQPRQRAALPAVAPRGGVPAQVGTGTYSPPPATGGGGIASPLVEQPGTREYYTAVLRPSTDGAVFFSVRATKTIVMTDANGAEVVMEFQNVTS
jgi:hypothetical protein